MFAGASAFTRHQKDAAMHRQFDRDPTEFFSVVGAPYVRERVRENHAGAYFLHERRIDEPRPRKSEIGFATVCAGLGAVLLGISLFASNGAARLGEVAAYAVKTR
jgi:hypothetical protein